MLCVGDGFDFVYFESELLLDRSAVSQLQMRLNFGVFLA